jgi:hypothetical protein
LAFGFDRAGFFGGAGGFFGCRTLALAGLLAWQPLQWCLELIEQSFSVDMVNEIKKLKV